MKLNKKLIYSFIIYLIFTLFIISILFIARNSTKNYLLEAEKYSEEINKIKENLNQNNLEDYENAEKTIEEADSIANKGLIINYIIFPVIILILFISFQIFYWKINTNSKTINIFIASIINLFLILFLLMYILNYIDYKYFYAAEKSLFPIILLSLFYIIFNYFSNINLVKNNRITKDIKFGVDNFKNLFLTYLGLLLVNVIYLILIFGIFAFSFVGYSIIIPSIFTIIIIFIIVLLKNSLIDKIL